MKFKIFFCVALCVAPTFLFASKGDFTRTLSLGMRGEDVRELQKVLNKDTETRVADGGVGSLGNETDYFGQATKRALVKFQEKYRGEILEPVGLVSGTGVFGAKTRIKAATLKKSSSIANSKQPPALSKSDVIVMFPSQYSGKPGTVISISGTGFTSTDNTIYFGIGHAVEKAASWNGQSITFKIPAIPKGNYPLSVKNAQGESNKDSFFVVTDGVTPEPKIEKVSPARAGRGAVVSVNGSGFTSKGNVVRTGISVINDVSSADGTTLSFKIPLDILTSTTTSPKVKKGFFPVWVYIVNENGVSNGKSFDLEI